VGTPPVAVGSSGVTDSSGAVAVGNEALTVTEGVADAVGGGVEVAGRGVAVGQATVGKTWSGKSW
jgi:hypothetical protein